MRLMEQNERPEDHFTEGELDLEPPEELAVAELDDETLLEEDLDNDDVAEEDVDEDVLEFTLEDLVHSADDTDTDARAEGGRAGSAGVELTIALHLPEGARDGDGSRPGVLEDDELDELDDLEVPDLEDVEESLDHILAERLAGDSDEAGADEDEEQAEVVTLVLGPLLGSAVSPCREDEFVCSSCFLVRKRAQLADSSARVCRDCAS